MSVRHKWQRDACKFEVLQNKEFDRLCDKNQFIEGPFISKASKWMSEFGPYNPHRWAFGKLGDGRLVCCDTAAEAAEAES